MVKLTDSQFKRIMNEDEDSFLLFSAFRTEGQMKIKPMVVQEVDIGCILCIRSDNTFLQQERVHYF